MMNTIQEQWQMFSDAVMPKDAPALQVTEMRRAFYAGVGAMLRIQLAIGGIENEDSAVAVLEGVHDECERFAIEVLKGNC